MLGLSYQTKLTYSYTDKKELEEIHLYEHIKDAIFFEEENVVQYIFDRRQYILLSDLLFKIQTSFIRFHLGQLLILFQKLLQKVESLRAININHEYLDINRIWLCLDKGSQQLNIKYSQISYSIVFTGYQCPAYELGSQQKENVDISILKSIQIIIDRLKNSIILQQIDETFRTLVNREIYELIKSKCETKNYSEVLLLIDELLFRYQYRNDNQTISFDDMDNDFINVKKGRDIKAVIDDINPVLYKFKYGNQVFLEFALNEVMLLQVMEMNSWYYEKIQFDDKKILKIHELHNCKKNSEITSLLEAIEDYSKQEIIKIQNQYKFDISEQDHQNMNAEIYSLKQNF